MGRVSRDFASGPRKTRGPDCWCMSGCHTHRQGGHTAQNVRGSWLPPAGRVRSLKPTHFCPALPKPVGETLLRAQQLLDRNTVLLTVKTLCIPRILFWEHLLLFLDDYCYCLRFTFRTIHVIIVFAGPNRDKRVRLVNPHPTYPQTRRPINQPSSSSMLTIE